MNELSENYSARDYLEKIVNDKLNMFKSIVTWDEAAIKAFKLLRSDLDNPVGTTKEKGDRLERLVQFIIRKSYFFEVYKNVPTETNEIDEIIVLSNRGKQMLKELGLDRSIIPVNEDCFLGECKNYSQKLNVTYIGKFYSLIKATGISFGILFTRKGLTGKSEGFQDGYGLLKILRMRELYENGNDDFFLIAFSDDDYRLLEEGKTFFELVEAKKKEIIFASNINNFLKENEHPAQEEVKDIINRL